MFDTGKELIRQLKSAPIATEGMDAGEAVDKKWEGEHGHAIAAARYGAMSRPARAGPPDLGEPDDWRTYVVRERLRKCWRARGRSISTNSHSWFYSGWLEDDLDVFDPPMD